MVGFWSDLGLFGFLKFEHGFGLSIGTIIRNTHAMFLNAHASVLEADRRRISQHSWSAWWSDFVRISIAGFLMQLSPRRSA